ncbi:peptidase M28-like protein [Leptotrombidium deliense]|uniref:Peptidase M28-like protein n=1 Tax=Leptotrombidium deliense TaxID=299467 RepID=A0A443S5A7_9ACAR|nr:peptidase M28-like protein [Leptotrombidium deliense]
MPHGAFRKQIARNYLMKYLTELLGKSSVSKQKVIFKRNKVSTPIKGANIIAKIGDKSDNKDKYKHIIVVAAHYDTGHSSAGVGDNGSGVTVVLELARIFHEIKDSIPDSHELQFVLFDLYTEVSFTLISEMLIHSLLRDVLEANIL